MQAKPSPISGHVHLRDGKRGQTWYAKYRGPVRERDGRIMTKQTEERIGPAWTGTGRPPGGHFTEKTAKAWLAAKLTDLRRGVGITSDGDGVTFREAADEWLRHAEQERQVRHSTMREYRSVVNARLAPRFGDLCLDEITTATIENWRRDLTERGDPCRRCDAAGTVGRDKHPCPSCNGTGRHPLSRRTIDKFVTITGGIFKRARRVYGHPVNPVADVEHHRHPYSGEFDFYSPEEVLALVRAAETDQDAAIFLTAAFTGLRRGELVALRWRDIDFTGEAIRVHKSVTHGAEAAPKSGKVRVVPMVPEVASALAKLGNREQFTGDSDLVFPGDTGAHLDASALRRRYKAAQEKAQLRPLRFHDLRHTFGSLAINRASIVQVQSWMGHADIDTTRRYLHVKHRGDEARLLADAFRVEDVTADVRPSGHPGTQR